MEYLIAVDLEGVHGVVGEPYKGLTSDHEEYAKAVENATDEVNEAVKALFDAGATDVYIWDCHAGKDNLDFTKIDSRAKKVFYKNDAYRMDFAKQRDFKGVVFIGYHSKEGSLKGVLAHTYNSSAIQYIKINGQSVGEIEIDSYVLAQYKVPPLFVASDTVAIEQAKQFSSEIVTVETKIGKSRNEAIFREKNDVLRDIYNGVKLSVKSNSKPCVTTCPLNVEIRYTRVEKAMEIYNKVRSDGAISVEYGEDAHVLQFVLQRPNQIPTLF